MKKTVSIFLMFFMVFFMISVCHAKSDKDVLNYRLKWLFNTSVAGDIWADSSGSFTAAGLNVTVKEGSPEKNAINELELGYAAFGVASADQVIRAVEKGADIMVIAQLFQVNPMQWIYRTDHPRITTLADLKGRHIGITFGGNDETIMKTLLARAGLTEKEVKLTGVRFDFTPFLRKKVDVWPVYRNSQGVILHNKLARENEKVYFFNPSDFGVNFVANSVITSARMLKDRPDIVARFLRALLNSWEAAMDPENEVAVLGAVKRLDKGNDDEIRRQQLVATRDLVQPSETIRIGTIDVAAWQQTERIMVQEHQIKKPVNIANRLVQLK